MLLMSHVLLIITIMAINHVSVAGSMKVEEPTQAAGERTEINSILNKKNMISRWFEYFPDSAVCLLLVDDKRSDH